MLTNAATEASAAESRASLIISTSVCSPYVLGELTRNVQRYGLARTVLGAWVQSELKVPYQAG